MIRRRIFLESSITTAAATFLPGIAQADDSKPYPSRPIVFVCPYDAGGSTDITTRFYSTRIAVNLSNPTVVENRAGGSGIVGTTHVARKVADGYTVLFGSQSTMAANVALFKSLSYDPLKDFIPIHGLTENSPLLLTNADTPFRTAAELIAYAKANPGKLNFGSSGMGTGTHLFSELLQLATGIRFAHIPHRNTTHAVQSLVGGTVDLAFDFPGKGVQAMIDAGKLRPILYTGKARWPTLPDVPTVVDLGFPNAVARTWGGFFVAASTPPAIVRLLEGQMSKLISDPETARAAEERLGGAPMAGMGSAQMRQLMEREIATWRDVVTKAGISIT